MKVKRVFLIFMILSLFSIEMSYANAGSPPALTILSSNCPEDLNVYFIVKDEEIEARKIKKLSEYYFTLDNFDRYKTTKIIFRSSEKTFEINKPRIPYGYDVVMTLDFENESLTEGTAPLRQVGIIAARVLITLFFEGAIFFLMGFRETKSWIIFLVVNLVTQFYLNLQLATMHPLETSHLLGIFLVFYEVIILIVELVFFTLLIKEHRKLHIVKYVVTANLLSLIFGMILIPALPI